MSNATIERCRANVAMLGFLHPAFLLIHQRIRDRYRIVTKEQGYGTMAMTSSGSILVNEEFAAKLTSDELQGVLAHEMLHLVLMHHSRTGNRDHYIANVAEDMVMNDALRKDGIKLPASALYVPQEYTGDMFAEALYEWLVKNPQHLPKKKGCDKCGGTGKKSDGSDCDCDGQGDAAAGCGVVDEDDQNPDKPDWKRIAVEARAHARSAGQGSSGVAALLAPRVAKIDFKKVIRHGFEATSSSRKRDFQTYAKRNRRSPPRGVQLPGWHGQDPSIAVVVDASGSMDREWINIIAAEVISLMRTFGGVKVYLAVHTSELVWAGWLKATDSWKLSEALSFTGGTDPQPAYDAVKFATKGRCDNLIHFTDTEFGAEWPAVPAKHLIVGAFGRNISTKPPAGAQVIFCDMEGRR